MHALTLCRPWGTAIMRHGKNVENRSWHPPHWLIGKALAIHNGKKIDNRGIADVMQFLRGENSAFAVDADALCGPSGCITGVVIVTCSVTQSESPWFSGPVGWVLSAPIELRDPIPCRGKQGLWVVPPEIETAIREELAQ